MLIPFSSIKNFALAASDGEIGKVKRLYFDDRSWRVRYFVVDTGGWLSGREVLIAPRLLGTVDGIKGRIPVGLTREQVESSPPIEADKPVSRQYEERWHQHYGLSGYSMTPETTAFATMPPMPVAVPMEVGAIDEAPAGDPHLRSTGEVFGYPIRARDGDIGEVDDVVVDDEEWRIRYLCISQGFWAGKRVVLSPEWIEEISWDERRVVVGLSRETIKDAPEWLGAEPMTREFEESLHRYYDRPSYWPPIP